MFQNSTIAEKIMNFKLDFDMQEGDKSYSRDNNSSDERLFNCGVNTFYEYQ